MCAVCLRRCCVLAGRKTRYVYIAKMQWNEDATVFTGVEKVDLQSRDKGKSSAGSIVYGPSVTGGEAFFVPSHTDPARCDGKSSSFYILWPAPVQHHHRPKLQCSIA